MASSTEEKLLLDIAERFDDVEEAANTIVPSAIIPKAGIVKMATNVAEATGEIPIAAEFKALIDALIAAGIMAAHQA